MTEYQIIKHKVGKKDFEALTNVGTTLQYREGKLSLEKVLASDAVFKNAAKGDRASADELRAAFGTDDSAKVLKLIVEQGELPLSQKERKEKLEKRRAEIVNYIHKYYGDPRAKTPHPVVRIENALEVLKVRVDPDVPAERQAQDIVRRLPEVMPIKRMEMEGLLFIPNASIGAAYGVIGQWAKILSEHYASDGCNMQISFVPGVYDALMGDLNKVTKGEFQFDIAGGPLAATSEETVDKGKAKKSKAAKSKMPRK